MTVLPMLVIDNDTSPNSTESYLRSGIAGIQQGRVAGDVSSFENEFRDNDQSQIAGGKTSDSSGVAGDQETSVNGLQPSSVQRAVQGIANLNEGELEKIVLAKELNLVGL